MLKSKLDTEKLTINLGLIFSQLRISPNTWTFLGLLFAFFGFLSLSICNDLVKGLTFFAIAGLIDAIDGAVARVTGRASTLGAFLDGIIDRYVEILLYIGLLFLLFHYDEKNFLMISVFLSLLIFASVMSSYVRAYAHHKEIITEKEEHKKMGGFLERAERLFLIYIGMFLGIIFNFVFLEYFIIFAAIIANFTVFQRIFFVVRYVRYKRD